MSSTKFRIFMIISALLIVLAGCSGQIQEKEEPDCFCITMFDPVCADGATYSNSCFAECAGKTDYAKGACPE